jgi:hypothetical protein
MYHHFQTHSSHTHWLSVYTLSQVHHEQKTLTLDAESRTSRPFCSGIDRIVKTSTAPVVMSDAMLLWRRRQVQDVRRLLLAHFLGLLQGMKGWPQSAAACI